MQPVVRLGLARILNEQFGMRGVKAVAVATDIINHLRAANMDIVKGDWMAGQVDTGKFAWEDIAGSMSAFEDDPRAPWNTPELK